MSRVSDGDEAELLAFAAGGEARVEQTAQVFTHRAVHCSETGHSTCIARHNLAHNGGMVERNTHTDARARTHTHTPVSYTHLTLPTNHRV